MKSAMAAHPERITVEKPPPDDVPKILIGVTAEVSLQAGGHGKPPEGIADDIRSAELASRCYCRPEKAQAFPQRAGTIEA
jgi:hypothetical protein